MPTAESQGFRDRRHAGRMLAAGLAEMADRHPVVVALPRGGVPVAYEVSQALNAPLDIALVRKLGAPMQPELGIGAIGEDGRSVHDAEAVRALGVSEGEFQAVLERERRELERRRLSYRPDHPAVDVEGRTALLIDDGVATGLTAVAAARTLRDRGAREVILAVPACPRDVSDRLRSEFDGFLCLRPMEPFRGVGFAYEDFTQTSDEEVVELLARSRRRATVEDGAPPAPPGPEPAANVAAHEVAIPHMGLELLGTLQVPIEPVGLVVFVHGSGSSRLSPRNRAVAARLNGARFATLLFDLLTEEEAEDRANVFDIPLLGDRLLSALAWAKSSPDVEDLPIGLFGASTGAAAAMHAAASSAGSVDAIVSRGGRPDLAGAALGRVTAPTLLIVGGADQAVLELNRRAASLLGGRQEVAVIKGAGHLFEEPGALERVATLATAWFLDCFAAASTQPPKLSTGSEPLGHR